MVAHTGVSAIGILVTETNEHLGSRRGVGVAVVVDVLIDEDRAFRDRDRKSTRLNSSHSGESRMPSSA